MGELLKRFVAIFAAVLVAGLDPAASRTVNIRNSWLLPHNDFPVFYRHFRDRVTWFEADAVCQFHHAQLVTVETNTQFEATRNYLKELDVTENVWIGLKRNSQASEFLWTNYQPLARSGYFREEAPLSSDPICVVTDPTANFKWHSLHCGGSEVASFVCELPVPYWATKSNGCMTSMTEGITVTFLPERPAVQLIKECGPTSTKNITCQGNMSPMEIIEKLACLNPNAPSSTKRSLKPTAAEIRTTTSSSESDLEDYAIEMATISQYNDETFRSISKVMGRGLPQEMSIDQEPIKRTQIGFDSNGIDSAFMGAVPETTTDVVPSTTTTAIPITITTVAPTTTTVGPITATAVVPSATKVTTHQTPTSTRAPSAATTTEQPGPTATFIASTAAADPAGTAAEQTPPIVQGSIFTTVTARTAVRDALATSPRTTATVVSVTAATSDAGIATDTSAAAESTTTSAGRQNHHRGHHLTDADITSPTFTSTTEKIRTIAKILTADQRPPTDAPTTDAVTRLAEYALRKSATATATTSTTTGRPPVLSTSSPKIPYTMATVRPAQAATPRANARVPITGSSDAATQTTTPTSVGDVTTAAQHYRRYKKIDYPQMPLDDEYPFSYKTIASARTAIPTATTLKATTLKATIPTATTVTATSSTITTPKAITLKATAATATDATATDATATDATATDATATDATTATANNIDYYAVITSAATIDTAEMARGTSVKTTAAVVQSQTEPETADTATAAAQTETTTARKNNDTTFATTSVTAAGSTTSDPIDDDDDWNPTTSSPSPGTPTTAATAKTTVTVVTTAVTAGHRKINYDTYTDHPSRSRHIIRPKQQHHHSYPYILYRLLG